MLSNIVDTEKRLRELGMLPGMRVAMRAPNSAPLAVAVVACWRIGAVAVPLSMRYTEAQVAEAIEGMACDMLITQAMLERLCPFTGHVLEQVCLADLDLDLSQDATIVLTSGSTGRPKGVLHTLGNHVASARASDEVLPFARGDVWLVSLPLCHVGGLALIVRALVHGGSLQFAGKDWHTVLIRETVTHLSVVPTQLKRLLDIPEACRALQTLKVVLVGGAPCPDSLVDQARALDIPVHVTYGASEAASQITTTGQVPIGSGSVLSHSEVRIGEDHEILARGQSLARGYVAEGQVLPLVDEQGWFHTGDLGRMDSHGNLFVLGRRDSQFISGGENIWPEEIERALLQVPEVEQCVVVPVPDATFGQRPVAFVACSGSGRCDQALTRALSHLETFKHPDHVFDWPREFRDPLKPDRPRMQALAKSLLDKGCDDAC